MFRAPPGQWTIDTLNEHFTALLDQQDRDLRAALSEGFVNSEKSVTAALAATNKAIDKADIATDNRFEAVNEFRSQLGDLTRLLMPRLEAERINMQQGVLIDALSARVNKMEGSRSAMYAVAGLIGLFAGVVVAVIGVLVG